MSFTVSPLVLALLASALRTGPLPRQEPAPPAEPAAEPALDLDDASLEERLALALVDLDRGRARAALARLEALPEAVGTLAALLARERRRVASWVRVSEAHLAALAASGGTLEFTREETKQRAKVLAFEGGRLTLEGPRGQQSLALEELDPLELAQQMRGLRGPDAWARFVPYALRGDPRTEKLLKDDGPEASALLADMHTETPRLLRLGALAARLLDLAARPLPEAAEEARAGLEELRTWRAAAEVEAPWLLARKRAALRAHARRLLERELALEGPRAALAGRLEVLSPSRVRLTYAFDEARELDDFEAGTYPPGLRANFPPPLVPDEPFRVEAGALWALGQASLRSRFELGVPLTVRYDLTFEEAGQPPRSVYFGLGCCDDGNEHLAWALDLSHLQVFAPRRRESASGGIDQVFPDRRYDLVLSHDGQRLGLSCEGVPGPSLAADELRAGALVLFAHSDARVRCTQLVLEGALVPESFERVARARIERELQGF